MNWVGRVGKTWQRQMTGSSRRRTASLFAVAAEVFEERIVLSDTALLPPPDPADFGLNLNDPISVSTSNPGYAPFMAAQLAYTNQFITSTEVTTGSVSVLDSYANSFNDTLGSGWSDLVGGAIYTVLPVSDATLANTSDAALVTYTAIGSGIIAIGSVVAVEAALGIGTVGGLLAAPPVVGAAAVEAVVVTEAVGAAEVITGTIEVTLTDSGTWIVGEVILDSTAAAEAAALNNTVTFSLLETWPVIPPLPPLPPLL